MKIVLFINTLASGGAERQICHLADGLVGRNHDVTIVTYGDIKDFYSFKKNINRKRLAAGKSKPIKLLNIFLYFLKSKADVVISFGQKENTWALMPLLFNKKIKFIGGERNLSSLPLAKSTRLLFKYLYKRADYIVPNSQAQGDFISNSFPELKEKIRVISNFTDTDKFTPKQFKVTSDTARIGIFARYASQKNYVRFSESLAILKRKGLKFHIDWFGKIYPEGNPNRPPYEEFVSLINKLNLEDYITLHDAIINVDEELKKFDAFCLPSIHEGFSNSLSEAICTGLPVLASDVSDNGIMVEDGFNGFLFNPLDSEDIASAIEKFVLLDTEQRQQMGNNSRKKAMELFDFDNYISQYEELMK